MTHRMIRYRSFAIALVVSLVLGRAASAEDYAIKMDRPVKVGLAYRSTATATSEMSRVVKKDGTKVEEVANKMVVTMVTDEKVLEVSPKGEPTKLECVVVKCEQTQDGQTKEVVAPGKKIVVQRKGKGTGYTIDNLEVEKDVAQALDMVLHVSDPDKPSEDETFGTAERKKVGDTWKGNADIVFTTMQKMGLPIQKEGLAATMKLADVKTVGGKPLMTLQGQMQAQIEKGGKFPGFPEWLSISSGKMDMSLTRVQPVDPAGQSLGDTIDMTMTMTAGGKAPDGSAITIDVTMRRKSEDKEEYK